VEVNIMICKEHRTTSEWT